MRSDRDRHVEWSVRGVAYLALVVMGLVAHFWLAIIPGAVALIMLAVEVWPWWRHRRRMARIPGEELARWRGFEDV